MTDLDTLADKADELARKFREPATFELVRACLNEAGINKARSLVLNALDTLADAQTRKREADAVERQAKEALDSALLNAEWGLVAPDVNEAGSKLLADDKKQWKKAQAQRDPEVVAAADALRRAEHDSAAARDGVVVADKTLSARRADLDAAIAVLNALALALPARKGGTA